MQVTIRLAIILSTCAILLLTAVFAIQGNRQPALVQQSHKGCISRGELPQVERGTGLDGTRIFLIHRTCEGEVSLVAEDGEEQAHITFVNGYVLFDMKTARIGIK